MVMTDDFPGVDWGDSYARAATFAMRRARRFGLCLDTGQAKEIAGDAIRQIIEAGWDRTKYPDFLDCLASRVNGIMVNKWRRKSTHAEVATEMAEMDRMTSDDSSRSPEQRFADQELASAACGRVLDLLNGNEAAVAVFMAMADGVDKAADIAADTGLPIAVVYRARERISVISSQVAEQLKKEMVT